MKLRGLIVANLVLVSFAVTVPIVHVFALPWRFALDADLWNQAFGYFNQAWGAYAGGVALVALFVSLMLFAWRRKTPSASLLSLNAVFAYAALSGLIFLSDTSTHQHVIALGLSVFGWLALLSASLIVADLRRPLRQG
ncbi:MAG: hypothetical protein Q7T44_03880 [Parvibaculum sp.]|nr:hypothetical protein [Parvibaculum sp.]